MPNCSIELQLRKLRVVAFSKIIVPYTLNIPAKRIKFRLSKRLQL